MGVDLGLGIWVDKYEVSVKTEDTVRERAFFVRLKITYVLGIRSSITLALGYSEAMV